MPRWRLADAEEVVQILYMDLVQDGDFREWLAQIPLSYIASVEV